MRKNIVRYTRSFLYMSILIALTSLAFTGCEEKQDEKPQIQVENTTEIFTPKDLKMQAQKPKQQSIKNKPLQKATAVQKDNTSNHFIVDDNMTKYEINLKNEQLSVLNMTKPIVLINLFQADCDVCQAHIKSLTKLDKKYKKKLQIINLFNDVQQTDNIRFINYIMASLDLPSKFTTTLSIIYTNGHYYSHFEDLVPIEMLQHDIEQAIKE